MNILIPHTWLLEHIETNADPNEIQKFLSLCGPSIERIYDREADFVYDIEVTTNRVDSMSVRGIAREAAVILQQFNKKAKLKPLKILDLKTLKPTDGKLSLPTIIDDGQLCKRTMAIVLKNVKRNATPEWMAKRLRQIEVNVHDAVIDITNYITHELGHPCHAFDYDKIMELGGTIIVKEAEKGKKFKTLDGVEYTTVGGEVVFENDNGEIIDLPGIKGTENTSISDDTRTVLFWIENIESKKIRFASMTHAIRTTAAQINEKHVDPNLAEIVFARGIELFQELTDAEVASPVYDKFPARKKPQSITVPLQRIEEYLGIDLPVNRMADILQDLGCEVDLKGPGKGKGKTASPSFAVTPPTFRPDLQIPADVIEEIARIYGYHNLPSVLMPTAIPLDKPKNTNFHVENRIKRFLAAIGWQEVYCYSMVSAEIAQQSGYTLDEHLKIQNPLTDDRVYLRRSLIPSLEEIISQNTQRKELNLFEIANVYTPQNNDLPWEDLRLTLVSNRPYRVVKGEFEALLRQFYLKDISVDISDMPMPIFAQSGVISVVEKDAKTEIGTIHVLPNGHTAIVIGIKNLIHVAKSHPAYQALPKTSEITEDLTFTLPVKTPVGPILEAVRDVSPVIRQVKLSDVYEQNHSLTIVYHDPDRHLTVEEISPIRKRVIELVEKQWDAKLVGRVE